MSHLDGPVALDPRGERRWWRRVVVGGGDDVDDLDGLSPAFGDGAADLGDLPGPRERDPCGCVDHRDRSTDPSAVSAAHGGVGGTAAQGRLAHARCRVGWFLFTVNT